MHARAISAIVIVACCAALLAGWWIKARCLADDGTWTAGEEYTSWCYSDIFPLWFSERLNEGAVPYLDQAVEYPVLVGAQMWLTSLAIGGDSTDAAAVRFFNATALTGAVFWFAILWLARRQGLSTERLLWVAAAPLLVVYAFMNWDPLAVLLAVAAIGLHRSGRDGLSGVAAGLGTAAKLFPGFLVPIVAFARWRAGDRKAARRHVLAAGAAWLAVNLPIYLLAPQSWRRFLDLNRERPADWDSLWFALERFDVARVSLSTLNLVSAVAFVGGAAAIVWIGAQRREPEELWQLLLPVVVWFLLVNKVYSPQFSLWLLPLLALALPSTAPFYAFVVADLMVFTIRFPFLGGEIGLAPAPGYPVFAVAVGVRAAVLIWILVIATLQRPQPAPPRHRRSSGSTARQQRVGQAPA